MRLIPLHNKGLVAVVDDEDYEWLNQYRWFAKQGTSTFYALTTIAYKRHSMHRMILGLDVEDKMYPDHIDRCGLNNQRINLRTATKSQNGVNRTYKNMHGYRGIRKYNAGKKWYARIVIEGIEIHEAYDSKEEAALAYNRLATAQYGEFAQLNVIDWSARNKNVLLELL